MGSNGNESDLLVAEGVDKPVVGVHNVHGSHCILVGDSLNNTSLQSKRAYSHDRGIFTTQHSTARALTVSMMCNTSVLPSRGSGRVMVATARRCGLRYL